MSLEYRTMQEIVYEKIRDAILSGQYSPGQRLVAEELARELGVSRMPVREALHRLESAGLVDSAPHRGTVVSELSEEEIIEIYHIRAVLEGLASRLATPRLTPKDHAQLKAILDEMTRAELSRDMPCFLNLNREFHLLIWKAAHAPRLLELLENLYATSQRYRSISLILPGRLRQVAEEHRQIAAELARGNAVAAERLANEHHENTAARLLKSIEEKRVQHEQA